MEAAEMNFPCRMAGLNLRDRVTSPDIWGGPRVEQLLLWVRRSQLRWFGHLVRMGPGQPHWRDYTSMLSWERLGVPQGELEVAGERSVWASLLRLLPFQPRPR